MTPKRLSHFELLDELGSGGMGVVYRARDLRLNRLVAVKVLPAASQGDAERRRFLAEAQAASGINHPAVVTIHEVDSDDGVDFIAMELVEGRSLAAELRHGPLPPARAVRFAASVADGLEAAHGLGLVHRDLKPGNLMIGSGDRVKILDFGLVKRVAATGEIAADAPTAIAPDSLTASGLLVGTPAYMSPEQARGAAVDARSDLFALGCVLYEMLTGRRAFGGENPVQVLSGVLSGQPDPPTGLSPRLSRLLARLLAKDPTERPASAGEAGRELEAILGEISGGPATVAVEPRTAWSWRWPAVLVGVALLAFVVYLAARPSPAPEYEYRLVSQPPAEERQACFSPDGASLAFVREDETGVPQLWVRNLAGGDALQLTHDDVAVAWPDWSRAGDRIVFARANAGIWEIPPFGGTPRRLVEHGTRPRLSADGRRIVFVSKQRLWTAAGDGANAAPVSGIEPVVFSHYATAAFSPDEQWIGYFWTDRERPLGDLWRIPAHGGTPERLTRLGFFGGGLDWSADGRWIVFSSDHEGSRTLWRVASRGGDPEAITRGAGEDSEPRLSPDGRRLVYTNQRNLYVIEELDPESGQGRRVYERRDPIFLPRLSHAGDRLAFFARVPSAFHLFVLPLHSGNVEQVTSGADRLYTHPRWSSDDRSLYFYAERPEPGLRQVDLATGGEALVLPGWLWAERPWAEPSPGDREIAYVERDAESLVATRVRSLADGAERQLPVALYGFDWFPDGRRLVGASGDRVGRVHLCDTVELACRELTTGEFPLVAAGGEAVYLLRFPGPVAWRYDLASGDEVRLAELAGQFRLLEFSWGVRPSGEIVWVRAEPGREELWLGEVP